MPTALRRTLLPVLLALSLAATAQARQRTDDAHLLRGPAVALDRVPTAAAQYTDAQTAGPALPPARRHAMFMQAVRDLELTPEQRRAIIAQDRAYTEQLRDFRLTREQSQPAREAEDAAPQPDAHHAAIWDTLTPEQRTAVTDHLNAQRDEAIRRIQANRAAQRSSPDAANPMRAPDADDDMSPGDPDTALDRARQRLAQLPPEQRRRLANLIERAQRDQPQGQPKPPPSMKDVKVPTP